MSKREEVKIGQVYNNWTVLKEVEPYKYQRKFLCRCVCGAEKIVFFNNMKRLNSSCGCYQRKLISNMFKTHGKSGNRCYEDWCKLKERCYNAHSKDYPNYGGRGIYICRRWRRSFESFYNDMGEKPSKNHTLDRIDNDGPYATWNCKWSTRKQQSRNKRNNVLISFNGETKCLSEWAEGTGFKYRTLYTRLFILKWSVKNAFTKKIRGENAK